jgi:predicted transcriptional regulator
MQKLTAKEEEVLRLIWQLGTCTPKEVQALYNEPLPHINTVAQSFQSLERKGYLKHTPKGRGYIYEAVISPEGYGRNGLKDIIRDFFEGSYKKAVHSLMQDEHFDEAELWAFLEELKRERYMQLQ